jgi:hypothetical protein
MPVTAVARLPSPVSTTTPPAGLRQPAPFADFLSPPPRRPTMDPDGRPTGAPGAGRPIRRRMGAAWTGRLFDRPGLVRPLSRVRDPHLTLLVPHCSGLRTLLVG